jgi:hypothetical protein
MAKEGTMERLVLLVGGLAAVAALSGCSAAQNEVIGDGPASLLFDNDGSAGISVEVTWTKDGGTERRREFYLESEGTVELRLADRLQYRIGLDANCPSSAASQGRPGQLEVITVGNE